MPLIYRNKVFVAISASTAQSLREIGVDPTQIRVIEPGIDYESHIEWSKSEEPLFLSLCRLVPHKRVELVLEAWRAAALEIPGRLIVAGDGPELENLRSLASSIPRVDIVGRVTDEEKWRLLGQSWAIVSAAHHEGWGLTAMEAAVAGTPSLAVDAPGVRDAIVDGSTGVLVHAEGDKVPHALARAWVDLAENAEMRETLGAAARERSSTFGWEGTVDRWLKLISEVSESHNEKVPMSVRDGESSNGTSGESSPTKTVRSRALSEQQALGATGLRRTLKLFQGFRTQYDDPDGFYTFLADDTVSLVDRYESVRGKTVVDVGGGPGYFAKAFRRAGATSCFVEPFWDALTDSGRSLGYGVVGDGMRMPFADRTFDISHSSNVIEHVLQPKVLFNEMVRVVRPGGLIFLAFTNWFSPFGGHETSPWHYLGGKRAALRYERKLGYAPKNHFGESLFRLDIGEVLAWARNETEAELIDAFPRYYPPWTKGIVRLPGVREVVTWNLVLVLRRR
jgi:SAM-dependent methyltransferase